MTVTIGRITFPSPCMDCASYANGCDHLARIVDELRKFAMGVEYPRNVELNVEIRCCDQDLCE